MSDPRIDDIEFPDDLARQRADFARSRVEQYFDVTRRAVRSYEAGTYTQADAVADSFDLWGRWVRDVSTGWLLGIRSLNRWADDTPVPREPRRRASIEVDLVARDAELLGPTPFPATDRPLSVGCGPLVRDEPARAAGDPAPPMPPVVISPAEVELDPNPLLDGDTVVTVSVDRSNPGGVYRGALLLFGLDPAAPRLLPIEIELDGRFDRR